MTRSTAARALISGLRKNPAFAVAFGVFVVWAYWLAWKAPIGPGQDQHYHFLGASITARWWLGDEQVRALYKFINPTDANTFVYTFLFPFEAALGPLNAWRVGFATLYFVGFPVACLVALRILRRPMWGALLAFPLAFAKSWSQGGYMPFVSAASFFVLALALLHRVLEDARAGTVSRKAERRFVLFAMAATTITFFAHAHVFTWLMVVLASVTVLALVRELVVGVPQRGLAAVVTAFWLGIRALVVVLPSLVFFASWYWRTHRGADAAHGTVAWTPVHATWNDKHLNFIAGFIHVKSDEEWRWLAVFMGVVLCLFLLAGKRDRRELPTPELGLALSFASFYVLPANIGQQSLGFRHVDFVAWLLPLVVVPAMPRSRLRAAAVLALVLGYSGARYDWLGLHMLKLQKEVAGVFQLAKPCPEPNQELAYATFGVAAEGWHGMALHQAHETYAAICKLDTPVYDPTEYPHNLLPVRYRGKPPAPVTILLTPSAWWTHPNLFRDFDLVMTHGWNPSPRDLEEASKVAVRLRVWKEWQLWAKKPDLSKVP